MVPEGVLSQVSDDFSPVRKAISDMLEQSIKARGDTEAEYREREEKLDADDREIILGLIQGVKEKLNSFDPESSPLYLQIMEAIVDLNSAGAYLLYMLPSEYMGMQAAAAAMSERISILEMMTEER